jgi:hypothetical protein
MGIDIRTILKTERERCAALVAERAAKWNDAARADMHAPCAESLADECEDIVAAILALSD